MGSADCIHDCFEGTISVAGLHLIKFVSTVVLLPFHHPRAPPYA